MQDILEQIIDDIADVFKSLNITPIIQTKQGDYYCDAKIIYNISKITKYFDHDTLELNINIDDELYEIEHYYNKTYDTSISVEIEYDNLIIDVSVGE